MRNETCRRRETLSAVSGPIYRTSEDESGRDDETDTNAPLIACAELLVEFVIQPRPRTGLAAAPLAVARRRALARADARLAVVAAGLRVS